MPAQFRNKLVLYLFGIVFMIGFLFLVFNENGLIRYLRLQNQLKEVEQEIRRVEHENKMLEAEIDSLSKKIPSKIERTARERYQMIKKNERSIRVEKK